MAYDFTIPVQTNQVRGASGDLIKMKENFEHLAPVALSGIHGLISGGEAAASGQVAVSQGAGGSDFYYRALTIPNLNDVTISGAASGQALTYNGSGWVNATPVSTLSGLSDTVISGATSGQALTYDGNKWVNDTPVSSLSGLSDTAVSGAVSGDALVLSGSTWVPRGVPVFETDAEGVLYHWDATRSKYLSVARTVYQYGRDTTTPRGSLLILCPAGSLADVGYHNGCPMPRAGVITSVTMQAYQATSGALLYTIARNASGAAPASRTEIGTALMPSGEHLIVISGGLDIAVPSGEHLMVYCTPQGGGTFMDALACVEIAWVYTP